MMRRPHATSGFAILFALVAIVGCGKPSISRKGVVPVQGTILVDGKAAAGAVVSFHPLGDPNPNALPSHACVADDGTYSLTTYVTADGAPEGEYVVTVYWAETSKTPRTEEEESCDLPPDRLKKRFATKEASVLRAKVDGKPTVFAAVDLGANDVVKSKEYRLREK